MVEGKNAKFVDVEKIENILKDFIEVKLVDHNAFSRVVEVLCRMGIPSFSNKTLTQSCHLLHKRGKYYIVHFKQMFLLDGKEATLTEEDINRLKTIATLLEKWNLIKIVNRENVVENLKHDSVTIVPRKDIGNWKLVQKYKVGKFSKKKENKQYKDAKLNLQASSQLGCELAKALQK